MADARKWTSCADQMPPEDHEVLVKNELGEGIGIWMTLAGRAGWMLSDGSILGDGMAKKWPTHWREYDPEHAPAGGKDGGDGRD